MEWKSRRRRPGTILGRCRQSARGSADHLHSAANAARHGAEELLWAKRDVTDTIEEAKEAGFTVEQDFSVTDPSWSLLYDKAERQAQAEAFATDIAEKVQRLASIDAEVAGKITSALAPLEGLNFPEHGGENAHDNTVQAVDYKTAPPGAGDGPTAPLPPPLPPGANDEDWKHGGDQSLPSQMSAGLKQKLVAAAMLEMERNGQTVSRDMLEHYLDNSGTPRRLSSGLIDSWLANESTKYTDAPAPALQIQRNLTDMTQQAYERAKASGGPVTITGSTPWATVAGSDGDSVRALGHYSVSTAYSVTMNPDGTYAAAYRNDVYDWYNFSTHPYSGVAEYISTKAHELQAAGVAQDFLVTGSGAMHSVNGRVS
ncbi:hypothetical protein [Mycobacterium sp. 141]|uniref:hypothetical protein n=1 Tax=Mycobacterium sp. 141 TaxID=1120797 RepID=UPI0012DEF125|nr:hypothetical protein [Mycobacterium sp. 141]